jgi:hypothetical protein
MSKTVAIVCAKWYREWQDYLIA